MTDSELIAADLILLLLAAPTEQGHASGQLSGITRLEKLLFLAEKEFDIGDVVSDAFEFKAYDFGPFSKQIYEEVDLLEQADLLTDTRRYGGETLDEMEELATFGEEREGTERHFELTENGRAVASLLARSRPDVIGKLGKVKEQYGRMPLTRLVRYVYETYPEYAERSVIRDRVLGH